MKKMVLHLNEQSKPITYENVINTYTKGGLFCVFYLLKDTKTVDKYPLCNIFRIREDYE